MKIPTEGVFYSPCHPFGLNGEPFSIEGTQCRTYREAVKEAEYLQRHYSSEIFVAEVTVKRVMSAVSKQSNRKAT